MIVFGAIYFLVPRIANQPWPSAPLIRAHHMAALFGTCLLVIGLAVAGVVQGRDLADAAKTFDDIAAHTRIWLLVAAAGQTLLLVGNIILALHFVRMMVTKPAVVAQNLFVQAPTMEATVS